MQNKYRKYLDDNITIEGFGLLKELLYKDLFSAATNQIDIDIKKLKDNIKELSKLKKDLISEIELKIGT